MASSYTPLGVELMVTGENAGTWGTKTNANLNLVEGITGGYVVATLNAAGTGANTTALTVADGALTGTAQSRVIILGAESPQAITGNKIVTLPLDVENTYYIKNSTSGAYTVQLKYASGSGDTVTWATTDKGWKIISASGNDGTNPDIYEVVAGGLPGGSNTQVQFNSSGSFAGSSNLTFDGTDLTMASAKVSDLTSTRVVTAGTSGALSDDANLYFDSTGLNIGTSKEIRLQDDSGGQYIGQKAANSTTSYTLTWPATTGSANQILQTNGSGVLSFVDNSGGTSWQAVKTGNYTASAGEGVFANTTSTAWTLTLPAGSIGDEVSFIDYAGTFDSNALTIAANGSEKINGSTADLTVSVERAANTLVYTDGTQGWLLKNK
jgi:hypothetical protein